jgi:hypothetical protein
MIIVNESAEIDTFLSGFHTTAAAGARRFLLHGEGPAVAFLKRLKDDNLFSHITVSHTSFDEEYVAATAGGMAAETAYREDWDAVLIFQTKDTAEVFRRIEHKALLPTIIYSGKRAVRPVVVSLAKSGTHLVGGVLVELGYDVVGAGGRHPAPGEIPVITRQAQRLGMNVPRWGGYDLMHLSLAPHAIMTMIRAKLKRYIKDARQAAFFSADLARLPENLCICVHSMPLDKVDGPFFVNWSNTGEPKIIFNYRDPRAIISSYIRFLLKGKNVAQTPDQYAHAAILRSMNNDHDRLMHAICDTTFPFWNSLRESTWLFLHPQILNLSYEELVGLSGGGSERAQLLAVMRMMLHLNVGGDPRAIARKAYKTDAATFSKGRIDTWRDEFKPEHLKAFNDRFGDLLAVYGYPADEPSGAEIRPGYLAAGRRRKDETRFSPDRASSP